MLLGATGSLGRLGLLVSSLLLRVLLAFWALTKSRALHLDGHVAVVTMGAI